jgi:predicted GNAT family N-acyltransferase
VFLRLSMNVLTREVDVLQLEDDLDYQQTYKMFIEKQGLIYDGCCSLNDLNLALEVGFIGRVNVVDGRFPRKNRGKVEELYEEAINTIREKYPEADIILFSGNDLREGAKKLGVEYMDKFDYTARTFAEILKKRLDAKT